MKKVSDTVHKWNNLITEIDFMYYFRVVTFSEFILEKLNFLSNYIVVSFLFLCLLKLYHFFIIFLSQNTENMCRAFCQKKVRHNRNNFFVFLSQNTENMCRTFFSKKVRHNRNNFFVFCFCSFCSRWVLFLFYSSSVCSCSTVPQFKFLETLRYESIIHFSFC